MYRYSRKCYNDLLLNLGGIRVGTLHDFRRSELGAGISDPEEGIMPPKTRLPPMSRHHFHINRFFILGPLLLGLL